MLSLTLCAQGLDKTSAACEASTKSARVNFILTGGSQEWEVVNVEWATLNNPPAHVVNVVHMSRSIDREPDGWFSAWE